MPEPHCSVNPSVSLQQILQERLISLSPEDTQPSLRRHRQQPWPSYRLGADLQPVAVDDLQTWARAWAAPWPPRRFSERGSAPVDWIRYVQARASQRQRWIRDWGWEKTTDWHSLAPDGAVPQLLGQLIDFGDHWVLSDRPLGSLAGLIAASWREVEALTLGDDRLRPLLGELDRLTAIALGQWLDLAQVPRLDLG